MYTHRLFVLGVLLGCGLGSPVFAQENAKGLEFFEKKIRPFLVEHCYKCHGVATNKAQGGLTLDTRAGIRQGGDTGPAVVPNDPKKSLILAALRHEGPRMPSEQKKLGADIIADVEAWIKMGAPDPRDGAANSKKEIDLVAARQHWAYQPPRVAPPAMLKNTTWVLTELDRYVLAKIEANKLQPTPDASPEAWLRRVTFDLTGLPPTPDEQTAFLTALTKERASAYATVVDRLLASSRFGEHWARHWLDGVRFDPTTNTIERYRDWVVRAFNADLPYDRFLMMQIAGDLLPATDNVIEQADRIFATQMLALNHNEMDPVEGMIEVLGQQVLGVSINCAKCHDHKFDAYTQQDYYALAGIFTSSTIAGHKGPKAEGVALPGMAEVKVLALVEGKAADTALLIRGERSRSGPLVPRRFPVVLADEQQPLLSRLTKQSGRLELARWTANAANPLTSRVLVNRVWQQIFRVGLVRTPNDFGLAGELPVNAPLLDSLAVRFAGELQWSLKKLLREMVLSRTYRQGVVNRAVHEADPDHRLFARMTVRRLTYEQTLDAMFATAGILSFDVPTRGKGANQYPRFGGKELPTVAYRALYHDDEATRRLFDGANPDLLTEKREESVTAPQMLFFLNHPHVWALAQKIAARIQQRSERNVSAQVSAAYQLLYARAPSQREQDVALSYLKANPLERLCHVLLASSEFSYLE